MIGITQPLGDLGHALIQRMLEDKTFDEKIASITQDLLSLLSEKAANPKNHDANLALGYFFLVQSHTDETLIPQALKHLESAHENGSMEATFLLAEIYSGRICFYNEKFANSERAYIMSSYAKAKDPVHKRYLEAIEKRQEDKDQAFILAQEIMNEGHFQGNFIVGRWLTDGFEGAVVSQHVATKAWEKILTEHSDSFFGLVMRAAILYWEGFMLSYPQEYSFEVSEQFKIKASRDREQGMELLRQALSFGIPEAGEFLERHSNAYSGQSDEVLPPNWYSSNMRVVSEEEYRETKEVTGNPYLRDLDRRQSGGYYTIKHIPSDPDEFDTERYQPSVRARIHFPDEAAIESRGRIMDGVVDDEAINAVLEPLGTLPGLGSLKKEVGDLLRYAMVIRKRQKEGLSTRALANHMVFSGNPGTGKTLTARMVGTMFYQVGLLEEGHVIETDASAFYGEYMGWTESKTQLLCEAAFGGVLFIDEAYNLTGDINRNLGDEATGILLKMMEDHSDKFIVIAAGYKDKMEGFLRSNPGLRSRFSRTIDFSDYAVKDKVEIFESFCREHDYVLEKRAAGKLLAHFKGLKGNNLDRSGNARGVRNLFDETLKAQAMRIMRMGEDVSREDLMLITAADIPGNARPEAESAEKDGNVVILGNRT